jgi:hypothetical protein
MPEALDKCVLKVMDKGEDEATAFAICRKQLGLAEDGSGDEEEVPVPDDEEMDRRIEEEIQQRQFAIAPVLRKRMVVASPIGKFVNGDHEGQLGRTRLKRLAERFVSHPRQVPIFLAAGQADPEMRDHVVDLDSRSPDGWVEAVHIDGAGNLEVDAKLHGEAAKFVLNDLVRGASIGTKNASATDGTPIGEVLHHIILTNQPFIKNLNVAAKDRGGLMLYFTAFGGKEKNMPDKKDRKELTLIEVEAKHAKEIKDKDQEVVELKGKILHLNEQIETMAAKLENSTADPEKDTLKERVEFLERKSHAQEVRELCLKGLKRGVLKGAWCEGFEGGNKGDEGTLSWFKASRFDGDMTLLKYQVEKAEPFVRLNQNFAAGRPRTEEIVLSEDDRKYIRKLGIDPDLFPALMKCESVEDFKQITKKGDK